MTICDFTKFIQKYNFSVQCFWLKIKFGKYSAEKNLYIYNIAIHFMKNHTLA